MQSLLQDKKKIFQEELHSSTSCTDLNLKEQTFNQAVLFAAAEQTTCLTLKKQPINKEKRTLFLSPQLDAVVKAARLELAGLQSLCDVVNATL